MIYYIAVTSSDGVKVDLHFGQADQFHVFQADTETGALKLSELRRIPDTVHGVHDSVTGGTCNGQDEAKISAIAELLQDCTYLLTAKIGIRPYRVLQRAGVSCMEISGEVSDAVYKLNFYYKKQRKIKGD